MSGANLATGFTTDNLIPSADILNKAWIRTSKEIQDMLRHGLLPDSTPADGTGYVFGGLDCARVGALNKTEVDPGAGFVFDSSIGARTHPSVDAAGTALSAWGAVLSDAPIQADHSAPHAALDRIDLVTIRATPGTDIEESVLQFGSAIPVNADTQTGPALIVTVTEGIPAPGPVAPAAPAGEILLCEVLVENAGGGGSFTYTDRRSWLGVVNRDAGEAFRIFTDAIIGTASFMFFNDRTRGLTHAWQMDMAESFPTFFRTSPDGSVLEFGGQMYPRMSQFDRQWSRATSWERCGTLPNFWDIDVTDFVVQKAGVVPGLTPPHRGARIRHLDLTQAQVFDLSLGMDMDGLCGLRPDAIVLDWELVEVLDAGNGETIKAGVHFWDASAAALIDIGAVPLVTLSNVLGDHLDAIALIASPPLIDDGDIVYLVVKQTYSGTAAGTNGEIALRTAKMRVKEGQT